MWSRLFNPSRLDRYFGEGGEFPMWLFIAIIAAILAVSFWFFRRIRSPIKTRAKVILVNNNQKRITPIFELIDGPHSGTRCVAHISFNLALFKDEEIAYVYFDRKRQKVTTRKGMKWAITLILFVTAFFGFVALITP